MRKAWKEGKNLCKSCYHAEINALDCHTIRPLEVQKAVGVRVVKASERFQHVHEASEMERENNRKIDEFLRQVEQTCPHLLPFFKSYLSASSRTQPVVLPPLPQAVAPLPVQVVTPITTQAVLPTHDQPDTPPQPQSPMIVVDEEELSNATEDLTLEDSVCPICTEPIDNEKWELTCGHTFHPQCLTRWERTPGSNRLCPSCRGPIH